MTCVISHCECTTQALRIQCRYFSSRPAPSPPRPARTVRTYVGGNVEGAEHGHLPLPEARRWALGQLEEAEALLADQQAVLDAATIELRRATASRDNAYERRQGARAEVKRRRLDLAWRMGDDEDEDGT